MPSPSPEARAAKSVLTSRRKRVVSLVASLPEAAAILRAKQHFSLEVRGRKFGYLLDDHHGDGRLALNCKTAPTVNKTLTDVAPERFHIPKYVGKQGWLGLWIDLPKIDWREVEDIITEAYLLTAPTSLVARVERPKAPNLSMQRTADGPYA
ncbi:MAG: MmcQ/YjbR family DNA-binding protein [Chthoniobacterales bacterium]|nr:MmcQ/YjbR family DNA-binding protein [Chthoniobacterales bacterium]